MMDRRSYRKLDVWQASMKAYREVRALSMRFPAEEKYGLTSQIRRAALSVPSNIAEGYGRKHRAEYLHHLYMARGSLMECETQLIAAVQEELCIRADAVTVWKTLQINGRLLNGLIASLEIRP